MRKILVILFLSVICQLGYSQIAYELTFEYYPINAANVDRPVKSEVRTKVVYVPNDKYQGFVTKKADQAGLFWVGYLKRETVQGKTVNKDVTYIEHSQYPIKLRSFNRAGTKKKDGFSDKEKTAVQNLLNQL